MGYDRKGIRREVRLEWNRAGRRYDGKGIHGDTAGRRYKGYIAGKSYGKKGIRQEGDTPGSTAGRGYD